jgi:FkbM family methyltransferase
LAKLGWHWLKRMLRGTWVHRLLRPQAFTASNEQYDREALEVMARVLAADSCCVDIGAHKGDILREMLRVAPRGVHHAFEALPDFARQLREHYPAAVIHEAAIADKAGSAEFVHVEDAPAYSGLRKRIYDHANPQLRKIQVAVTTLDDAIPPADHVRLIKIDIEGGEYHAILGGKELLRRCQPFIVFEASCKSTGQYGVTANMMFAALTELGYSISTMRRWLDGKPPLTSAQFDQNWNHGPEYYFLAVPAAMGSSRGA